LSERHGGQLRKTTRAPVKSETDLFILPRVDLYRFPSPGWSLISITFLYMLPVPELS